MTRPPGTPSYWSPDRVLEGFCAFTLVVLIVLTVIDVVGRYLLASPVPGAFEYVRALMGILVFAGLPLTTARGEHLRAGLFEHMASIGFNRVREPLIEAVSLFALCVLAWRLGAECIAKYESGELLQGVPIRLWALISFMTILCSVSAVIVAWKLVTRPLARASKAGH